MTAIQATRAAAMLEREGMEVTLESGPYGSFKVRVDDDVVVDGGALAFLGVLPTLKQIRDQVKEHVAEGTPAAKPGT